MDSHPLTVLAFYKFLPLEESVLTSLRDELFSKGNALNVKGLFIVSTEGCNATIAGNAEAIREFQAVVEERFGPMKYKEAEAKGRVFRIWKVQVREEIVAIGDTAVLPPSSSNNHLSPQEWDEMLKREDVIVVDTRNTYETEIGMFKNAIDPKISTFKEFPEYVERANLPKDKKILLYCTGGIRCEKAVVAMQEKGYKDVYQLEGGILQYIKELPEGEFQGECFVFDHRVAVDRHLEPSKTYKLCMHCGNPGDNHGACLRCTKNSCICKQCASEGKRQYCSKRCMHEASFASLLH